MLIFALPLACAPPPASPQDTPALAQVAVAFEHLPAPGARAAFPAGTAAWYWTDGLGALRVGADGVTASVDVDPAGMRGAGRIGELEVVVGSETSWVWDGELVPVALGVEGEITQVRGASAGVWVQRDGLWVRADGDTVATLNISGAPTGCLAEGLLGDRAVAWLGVDSLLVAVALDSGDVLATHALDAPCDGLGVDSLGRPWVAAAGELSLRAADGSLRAVDAGEPVWALHGAPGGGTLWIPEPLRRVDGDGVALVLGDVGAVFGVDALGRLLAADPGGVVRVAAAPALWIDGVRDGESLTLPRVVTVNTTAWLDDMTILVTLDGPETHILPVSAGKVTVDPATLATGAYTLQADATWPDGATAGDAVEIRVGLGEIAFALDIEPISDARCAFCHFDGGQPGLVGYDAWVAGFDLALAQVSSGEMPLGGPALSPDELGLLRAWAAGGFLP